MWVHRLPCWDDWLMVRSRSSVSHGSRALTQREIFERGGALVASVSQEA